MRRLLITAIFGLVILLKSLLNKGLKPLAYTSLVSEIGIRVIFFVIKIGGDDLIANN